jgi:hypothetical protein
VVLSRAVAASGGFRAASRSGVLLLSKLLASVLAAHVCERLIQLQIIFTARLRRDGVVDQVLEWLIEEVELLPQASW